MVDHPRRTCRIAVLRTRVYFVEDVDALPDIRDLARRQREDAGHLNHRVVAVPGVVETNRRTLPRRSENAGKPPSMVRVMRAAAEHSGNLGWKLVTDCLQEQRDRIVAQTVPLGSKRGVVPAVCHHLFAGAHLARAAGEFGEMPRAIATVDARDEAYVVIDHEEVRHLRRQRLCRLGDVGEEFRTERTKLVERIVRRRAPLAANDFLPRRRGIRLPSMTHRRLKEHTLPNWRNGPQTFAEGADALGVDHRLVRRRIALRDKRAAVGY